VGVWTLVATIFVAQNVAREVGRGRGIDWQNDVFNEGVYWFAFALLTPLFVWLCRRFSLIASARWRNLAVHLLVSPAVAAFQAIVYYVLLGLSAVAMHRMAAASLPGWLMRRQDLPVLTIIAFWKYWVIVGLLHGIAYARAYAREHQAARELREQLTAAQLHQLKARLQPHFLFNALNGIAVLVRDDPERGRLMLVRLSQLLRSVIDAGDEQVVPLREEMRLVEQYLEIQQMRFGERLRVTLDVPPNADEYLVPHFLLQPLVENAVRHGVSRSERGGTVTIRVRPDDAHLTIDVIDVPLGPVASAAESSGTGIGLATTRERLAALYGSDYALSIEQNDGAGTLVRLRLPVQVPSDA
jgi:two-component system, LytTR family, sensor kinase